MREVIYPSRTAQTAPLKVEFLEEDEAVELTPSILRLIVRAYGHQFEGKNKPLPQGVFQSRYGSGEKLTDFRENVIPRVYERGGGYTVVRKPHDRCQVSSVLKTLPGAVLHPRFTGMSWIAEILTDPDYQHQGQASAVLHAHLTHTAAPDSRLVLEAFDVSPVNAWYERLNFEHEGPAQPLVLGEYSLPEHYMVTPEHIVAGSVRAQLAQRSLNIR
jgi:ribosomal protein S18 acetylase RimI-like enzyme